MTKLRILVAGGPRTGKTTFAGKLAKEHGLTVRHTDDLIGVVDWSGASLKVAGWMTQPGPWLIEGVAIGRALRKWLAANPLGKPADQVFWSNTARVPRDAGQEAMARGCETVWAEVLPQLRRRGMRVETF